MKILTVLGTRPEAIKLAPVVRELQLKTGAKLKPLVCVTAQHREMLDQVLHLFEIKPDYDFNIMQSNQTPTQVFAGVLTRLEPILREERPDWVVIQGDTTTAAATAIAAFYNGIKVGHVEAGLRTYNKWHPFPEEINRRMAGIIADLHFAPTQRARQNLLKEGVPDDAILVTGNPVIDALHWIANQPIDISRFNSSHPGYPDLAALQGSQTKLILVTVHRRENFGKPLENICLALRDIAACYEGRVHIVFPVHLNPNVWEPVHRLLGNEANITLLTPLDYLPLIHLMKQAYLVLTDSGGIQEEAPGLGKPVLVLRDVTERPEGIEAGTGHLVGTDQDHIVTWTQRLLDDQNEYSRMARAISPYGDGQAAKRIVDALLKDGKIN